ncbi:MBL fold metallo-hydrolase [Krasilnikovia sp. MM14-A1259]|uniref:MBL fold metallo-hydrolase n=1 Tax=Krasilnikovia sp. MM14-A1259 TaxID=3373539 RepID=UPI00399CE495
MAIGIAVVETSSLGDRTYLVHDGDVAAVVDPQRDIDRVLLLAGRLGVTITHVAETHLHNDYVSGGLALARLTGAAYLVAGPEHVAFDRVAVADGDEIAISDALRLRVLATPGHTFHHVSYVVLADGAPVAVCTGGSLLYGTTGRTDLLGARHTRTLAAHQHASARKLAAQLPAHAAVWPTHGFGSFCSAAAPDADSSTIGREREVNPALRLGVAQFVTRLLAGLGDYPAYYAHMGVRNASGAAPIDLSHPPVAGPDELHERITAGQWVVDLRPRKAFAYRHLAGTLSFGLDGSLATWLGWLLPPGASPTLLGESGAQIAAAQRELARIGVDRPAAAATGAPEDWAGGHDLRLSALAAATFADLAAAYAGLDGRVIDVRGRHEWAAGHLEGAVHVPLPGLADRLAGLPDGTLWVHCAAGYRAAAAASLLARAGRSVVHVDDGWASAAAAGLPVTRPAAAG